LNVLGAGNPPAGLSADEQRAYDRLNFLYTKGIGYALEMGNRTRGAIPRPLHSATAFRLIPAPKTVPVEPVRLRSSSASVR
jgi:hypothetical protein